MVLFSSQLFMGQIIAIISPNTESAVVALGIANSICLQTCAIHLEVLSLWGQLLVLDSRRIDCSGCRSQVILHRCAHSSLRGDRVLNHSFKIISPLIQSSFFFSKISTIIPHSQLCLLKALN